jgi:hypothetical protein
MDSQRLNTIKEKGAALRLRLSNNWQDFRERMHHKHRLVLMDTDTFKENVEKYPQFQVALDQLHASGPEYVGSLLSVFPEVRQYVEEVTEKVYNGEFTPEQGVEELVNLANTAIEEYNLVNY